EGFEIHVHHPTAAFLDEALRGAYGVVRAPSRSKTVAVLREARVESRLQYLKHALLDESVEDGRDPELADTAILLWNRMSSHRLRLVATREEVLLDLRPMLGHVRWQLVHRHPVDAGAALVLL